MFFLSPTQKKAFLHLIWNIPSEYWALWILLQISQGEGPGYWHHRLTPSPAGRALLKSFFLVSSHQSILSSPFHEKSLNLIGYCSHLGLKKKKETVSVSQAHPLSYTEKRSSLPVSASRLVPNTVFKDRMGYHRERTDLYSATHRLFNRILGMQLGEGGITLLHIQ